MSRIRITEEQMIDRINSVDGRRFVMWNGVYAGVMSMATMECNMGHKWVTSVGSLVYCKSGCPECSKIKLSISKRASKELVESKMNSFKSISMVRWVDEYKNNSSRVLMRCDCGNEWESTVQRVVRGDGCRNCANLVNKSRQAKPKELAEIQLMSINEIEFFGWDGEYKNNRSKALVMCKKGHCWSSAVNNLLQGKGCPLCAISKRSNAKIVSKEVREKQINSVSQGRFVRWVGVYSGAFSKAVMMCNKGHEWSATVDSLVNQLTGCPTCFPGGFSVLQAGTIYLLRSECGQFVKVGISNNHKRRFIELKRSTPFAFCVIDIYHNNDGKEISLLEKEFHRKYESAGFAGFDGATEWLKFTPELLEEFRKLGVNHDNRKSKSS